MLEDYAQALTDSLTVRQAAMRQCGNSAADQRYRVQWTAIEEMTFFPALVPELSAMAAGP